MSPHWRREVTGVTAKRLSVVWRWRLTVRSGYNNTAGNVFTAPRGNPKNVILPSFFFLCSFFLVTITVAFTDSVFFSFFLHVLKLNLGNCQSSKSQSSHDDIKPCRTKVIYIITSRCCRTAGGNRWGKKSQWCKRKDVITMS